MSSAGEIDIVPYSERWEASHTAFAERLYPGKRRRSDPAYIRWKFRAPATGDVDPLLLAVKDDEVVGQVGFLPVTVDIGGQVQPLQWLCDLMVDPSMRGQGINGMITQVAFARGTVCLGTDPSAKAHRAVAALGMAFVDSSWKMVLPLKAGPVVATRYPQASRASAAITVVGAPVLRRRHRALHTGMASPLAQVCRWTDVVDLVTAYESGLGMPHVVHDREFLEWRAVGLEGWTREIEAVRTERGSFALLEREDHRLTVHEWHGVDDTETAALFGRILYIAGSYGHDLINTYAADDREKAQLERLGFQARRTRTTLPVHPVDALAAHGNHFAFMGYDNDYLL